MISITYDVTVALIRLQLATPAQPFAAFCTGQKKEGRYR
jgi:hypothetical protein